VWGAGVAGAPQPSSDMQQPNVSVGIRNIERFVNMKSQQRTVAESYWKAECMRDTEKVLEHYNLDGRFVAPGWDLVGHEQIRQYYESSARQFPGLEVNVVSDVADGDFGAVEWSAVLTSPDGGRYPIGGVNLITLRNGKFQEVRAYFDISQLPKAAEVDR